MFILIILCEKRGLLKHSQITDIWLTNVRVDGIECSEEQPGAVLIYSDELNVNDDVQQEN
jgi:hypothetical protein